METMYHKLDLPSKLIPYEGVEAVEIRMLKGKDEKLIGEFTMSNFESKFALLLKGVIKGIEPEKLTIGDRFFILVWLGINCYTNIYPVDGVCEVCLRNISVDVDLKELEKVYLPEKFQEPYELELINGEKVKLRLYRVADQIQYLNYVEKKQQDNLLYKLAQTMLDERNMVDRIGYLEELSTQDLALIRAFHDTYFHGVKMEAGYTCPKCGGAGLMPIPFRLDIIFPDGATVAKSLGRSI